VQDIVDAKVSDNQSKNSDDSNSNRKKTMKKVWVWLVVVLALAGAVGAALYYKNEADKVKNDPTIAQQEKNQAETDRVLTSVKSVILINETDAPTVARVEDPEKLKSSNQEFYKDIQTGDYLIIFPKRAIIFRESANQIINVAPIINTADLKTDQGTTPANTTVNEEE
jgi:hypothetical protein